MSDPRQPPAAEKPVEDRVADAERKLVEADARIAAAEDEAGELRDRLDHESRVREVDQRNARRFMRAMRRLK